MNLNTVIQHVRNNEKERLVLISTDGRSLTYIERPVTPQEAGTGNEWQWLVGKPEHL